MRAADLPHRPDVWVVAFVPHDQVEATAWWQRPLAPGYRHVFAFRALAEGLTEIVNHSGQALAFQVTTEGADAIAARFNQSCITMLAMPPDSTAPRAMLRGPMTCVEVVKALLGWRGLLILTPRQLERALRRRGARPVTFPHTPQQEAA
jgi:hypothetical protein